MTYSTYVHDVLSSRCSRLACAMYTSRESGWVERFALHMLTLVQQHMGTLSYCKEDEIVVHDTQLKQPAMSLDDLSARSQE